ncbi:MAG: hypothetical protein HGA31_05680 [Candidatus Moranbacteria bacterium]|nr:hypothetical protein [Candidatus Moranbacteria bacterium]
MGKQESKFKCRVCGHTEYTEVRQGNGILGPGAHSHMIHCYCEGCTTVFRDVRKFSVAETEAEGAKSKIVP